MGNKKQREMPVIVIPKGYRIEDFLDTDDSEFEGEAPMFTEEVKIEFERNGKQRL